MNKNINPKKIAIIAGITSGYMLIATGCGKLAEDYEPYSIGSEYVTESYSVMTDDDLDDLPNTITSLTLFNCHFISKLDKIPETCPNIETLRIDSISSLTDLSFIYKLKNLKKVELNNCVGIDNELIQYFKENNIEYKVPDKDIMAAGVAQEFIKNNITPNMNDEEKVKVVVDYVAHNLKYKLSRVDESNENPLSSGLIDKKGVCASFAYETNQLLRMAGVESYEIISNIHAWNLVNIDGEYYYIDVTNLGGGLVPRKLSSDIANLTNFGFGGYKIDPNTTIFTCMKKVNSDKIVIPDSLVKEVEDNISDRNLFNRYKNTNLVSVIAFLTLIGAISLVKKNSYVFEDISDKMYRNRIKKMKQKENTKVVGQRKNRYYRRGRR